MLLFQDKLLNIKEKRKVTLCLEIRCGKALEFRNFPCVGSLGECFFSQGQEDPQRDLGGGVGVKRGCLVILGKAVISGFSSG